MIVLFVIDLEHRILPDVITLPGIVHRVSCSASSCRRAGVDSLIGIVLGGGVAVADGRDCTSASATKRAWDSAT